jgi:hypothetical protein
MKAAIPTSNIPANGRRCIGCGERQADAASATTARTSCGEGAATNTAVASRYVDTESAESAPAGDHGAPSAGPATGTGTKDAITTISPGAAGYRGPGQTNAYKPVGATTATTAAAGEYASPRGSARACRSTASSTGGATARAARGAGAAATCV